MSFVLCSCVIERERERWSDYYTMPHTFVLCSRVMKERVGGGGDLTLVCLGKEECVWGGGGRVGGENGEREGGEGRELQQILCLVQVVIHIPLCDSM